MIKVEELVDELLRLPMNAYIAVNNDPSRDIEICFRDFEDEEGEGFIYVSLE